MRLRPISILLLAVLLVTASRPDKLHAQTTTSGGVTGVVTDQSHAVLPNADVEIRDINKGTTNRPKQTAMACTASSFFLPANTR